MEGYGYVSELSDDLNEPLKGTYIFHGNSSADDYPPDGKGIWAVLRPGHGGGFSFDGSHNKYSERFGCELSFALKMNELDPGSNIAILKYARGGSSIDAEAARNFGSWDPGYLEGNGINQYDHFLASLENALALKDIDGDGYDDKLIPSGIVWMQGEGDADVNEEIAGRYYKNLTELMQLIKEAFGVPDIPVVIGRISESGDNPSGVVWEYGDIVRQAQHQFVNDDPDAAIVTNTDTYSYSDPWHYDSEGFIDMGIQFAVRIDSLRK